MREAMALAGFKRTEVYMSENLLEQESFSDFERLPAHGGPPVRQMDSWNCYVVGLKA